MSGCTICEKNHAVVLSQFWGLSKVTLLNMTAVKTRMGYFSRHQSLAQWLNLVATSSMHNVTHGGLLKNEKKERQWPEDKEGKKTCHIPDEEVRLFCPGFQDQCGCSPLKPYKRFWSTQRIWSCLQTHRTLSGSLLSICRDVTSVWQFAFDYFTWHRFNDSITMDIFWATSLCNQRGGDFLMRTMFFAGSEG